MKKFLILIPILLWSIKPLNQIRKDAQFKDSLHFSIETDTLLLNYVFNELVKEKEELKIIQEQRVKLSTVLHRRKREVEREKLSLSRSKEDLKKYKKIEWKN